MDLELTGPLPENVITTILRHAESQMADGVKPKLLVAGLVLDHFAEHKAFDLVPVIKPAIEMQAMIFGNDRSALAGALRDASPALTSKLDENALVGLLQWDQEGADAALDIQATAEKLIRVNLKEPIAANAGKFLAKFGIVQSHIDAIVPAGGSPGTEPAPPAAGGPALSADGSSVTLTDGTVMDRETAIMLGLWTPSAEAAAAAPAGGAPAAPVPAGTPSTAAPDGAEIRTAFVAFGEALDKTDEDLAKRLGISRGTLLGMTSGKTQRQKCSLAQSRVMLGEIDTRIAKLMQAADILRRVRD